MKATGQGAAALLICVVLLAACLAGCTRPVTAAPGRAVPSTGPILTSPAPQSIAPGPQSIAPAPQSTAPGPQPVVTVPSAVSPSPAVAGATSALPSVGVARVNDSGCRSTERPVVLLHGTFSTVASNFSAMVPALLAVHRCLFALEYGNGGIAAVTSSAGEFADFVASVRSATGAPQVDVIAYSQGGLVLRTALRLDGLAEDVATAVLIAPSWNGTTSSLAGALPPSLCPACADQVAGSALLRRLAIGGDLDGTVRYAEISTRGDTVVTPIGSQVPTGPADRVRSLVVEDRCPGLVTDHVHLPAEPGVIHWVVSALATDGRPSPTDLSC